MNQDFDCSNISSHPEAMHIEPKILSPSEKNPEIIPDLASMTAERSSNNMEVDYEDSSQAITQCSLVQSTSTASQEKNIGVEDSGIGPEETIVFVRDS